MNKIQKRQILTLVCTILFSFSAQAYIRAIFLPVGGRAILMIQGYEAGQPDDPDARALYNMMKVPEQHQDSGTGKTVGTPDNAFNLTCATQGQYYLNVVCTITVANSDRSSVSIPQQSAQFNGNTDDVKNFYKNLAGNQGAFVFETQNHWIRIESTQDKFQFSFSER